jgi:hypothetical protein
VQAEIGWGNRLRNIHFQDREGDDRITLIDPKEIDCQNAKWMELSQDCAQWRDFVVAASQRVILLAGVNRFYPLLFQFNLMNEHNITAVNWYSFLLVEWLVFSS